MAKHWLGFFEFTENLQRLIVLVHRHYKNLQQDGVVLLKAGTEEKPEILLQFKGSVDGDALASLVFFGGTKIEIIPVAYEVYNLRAETRPGKLDLAYEELLYPVMVPATPDVVNQIRSGA